jgi:release factor glutamine methyltransferase
MLTVLEVIKKTADFFAAKGIDSPRLNAELLIGHALGLPRMQLYVQFERMVPDGELDRLRPLVLRRGKREPLQYILGQVDFFGLKLKADRRALIPRPETERLVELLVARCQPPPARVLDLGTGGGAIALGLARSWPEAAVTAVDLSAEALALAAENALAAGLGGRVSFLRSDWFAQLPAEATFDLLVANPPYLAQTELAESAPEVREHEPAGALAAAEGGLADLRAILAAGRRHAAPGALIALETGPGQHAALAGIARAHGWEQFESRPDLAARDRFVFARAPAS